MLRKNRNAFTSPSSSPPLPSPHGMLQLDPTLILLILCPQEERTFCWGCEKAPVRQGGAGFDAAVVSSSSNAENNAASFISKREYIFVVFEYLVLLNNLPFFSCLVVFTWYMCRRLCPSYTPSPPPSLPPVVHKTHSQFWQIVLKPLIVILVSCFFLIRSHKHPFIQNPFENKKH